MADNNIQSIPISKVKKQISGSLLDKVAVEIPLEIRLAHSDIFRTYVITMCSPGDIEDLIIGHLYSESVIDKYDDIKSIHVYESEWGLVAEVVLSSEIDFQKHLNRRAGVSHSSCGLCGKTEIEKIFTHRYRNIIESEMPASDILYSLREKMNAHQSAFQQTGGVHACAFFTKHGKMLALREDVGRHNALDKLIGASLSLQKNQLPISDLILLLSGRVSYEMVHKALMAGVCHLVAIGAPSTLSIELAQSNGMHLYGFLKKDSYNVYC